MAQLAIAPLFVKPGSLWGNGSIELFNGTRWDKLLNGKLFYTLGEAPVVIGRWWCRHNQFRPHSALGYWPLALVTIEPYLAFAGPIKHLA